MQASKGLTPKDFAVLAGIEPKIVMVPGIGFLPEICKGIVTQGLQDDWGIWNCTSEDLDPQGIKVISSSDDEGAVRQIRAGNLICCSNYSQDAYYEHLTRLLGFQLEESVPDFRVFTVDPDNLSLVPIYRPLEPSVLAFAGQGVPRPDILVIPNGCRFTIKQIWEVLEEMGLHEDWAIWNCRSDELPEDFVENITVFERDDVYDVCLHLARGFLLCLSDDVEVGGKTVTRLLASIQRDELLLENGIFFWGNGSELIRIS